MPLKINLKPGERIIVNGAILRNAKQSRLSIVIENYSSILRESEIIDRSRARATPAGHACSLIQTCLCYPAKAEESIPEIHKSLAKQGAVMTGVNFQAILTAGTLVSQGAFHKAFQTMKPVMEAQERLLSGIPQEGAGPEMEGDKA